MVIAVAVVGCNGYVMPRDPQVEANRQALARISGLGSATLQCVRVMDDIATATKLHNQMIAKLVAQLEARVCAPPGSVLVVPAPSRSPAPEAIP